MIALWITIAVLTAVALGLLLVPLARRGRAPAPTRAAYDITVYRDQLAEVDRDLERGLFGDGQAQAARIEIQRRMLAAGPEDGSGGTEEPGPRLCLPDCRFEFRPALLTALLRDRPQCPTVQ